jgi:dihydroorotate dehydrogenase (fumarate)
LNYFPESSPFHAGPEAYLNFVRQATEAVEIPIFGSLNGTTDHGWIARAQDIEKAGAKGLELNIYFIPTDLSATGRDVERRYLDILTAVRSTVSIPVAMKLSPYFSSFGHMAREFVGAGADGLVLFNRFYQPDVDIQGLHLVNDLQLSGRNEMRLPLLWIAVLAGRTDASLAASTGVETGDQVIKYLLVGADVVRGHDHISAYETWRGLRRKPRDRYPRLVNGPRNQIVRRNQRNVEPGAGP